MSQEPWTNSKYTFLTNHNTAWLVPVIAERNSNRGTELGACPGPVPVPYLLYQEVPDFLDDVIAVAALLQGLLAALLQQREEVAVHLEEVVRAREEAANSCAAELQLLLQGPGVDLEHDLQCPYMVRLCLHQLCGAWGTGLTHVGTTP